MAMVITRQNIKHLFPQRHLSMCYRINYYVRNPFTLKAKQIPIISFVRAPLFPFLREVKTCIALKNYSEARYSGPVICTFRFNNFYPIWSLFTDPCFLHAYISLARRVIPTLSPAPSFLTSPGGEPLQRTHLF